MVGPQAVWVDGPPAEPRPYGLFTAAQMVEDTEARWLMGGARYEVDFCGEAYDSAGVCWDFGTASLVVSDTGQATLTANGNPDGNYTIDWGDDDVEHTSETLTGVGHPYEPGDYTLVITGPRSYQATATFTVTDGDALPETDLTVSLAKVASDGIGVEEGTPFAVLHLLQCSPVGYTAEHLRDRARRALQMGEQRAVERVVARLMARDPRADTLAGGDVVGAVDALAHLEKYAGANYPGRAVIHATPDVITLLDRRGVITIRTLAGREVIMTGQGTLVVSGGGYSPMGLPEPDPTHAVGVPGGDAEVMYVTGAMQVRRTAEIQADTALDSTGGTTARNVATYLAERPYTVAWDCITAAVAVSTLDAGPA